MGSACCKQGQAITIVLGCFGQHGPLHIHQGRHRPATSSRNGSAYLELSFFACLLGCCQESLVPAALLGGSIAHPQVPLGCCPILGNSGEACPNFKACIGFMWLCRATARCWAQPSDAENHLMALDGGPGGQQEVSPALPISRGAGGSPGFTPGTGGCDHDELFSFWHSACSPDGAEAERDGEQEGARGRGEIWQRHTGMGGPGLCWSVVWWENTQTSDCKLGGCWEGAHRVPAGGPALGSHAGGCLLSSCT